MKKIVSVSLLILLFCSSLFAQGVSAINVNTKDTKNEVSPLLFSAIQNQGRNGEGSADANGKPYPSFVEACKTMGITELRYPGGSMGGMIFDWHKAIGPVSERPLTYARTSNPGQVLAYGVDEMAQMAEEIGIPLDLCINSHMLRVSDALEYLAYVTMSATDEVITDKSNLQYWANLRASYGHVNPYTVIRVDIGNEEDNAAGWRSGKFVKLSDKYTPACELTEENKAQALYAFGGITEFEKVNVITYEDLSENAAIAEGVPFEQKRAPYVDIIEGTCHIYVNDEEWTIVDDLKAAKPDAKVCTVDCETGYITFGDDVNGAQLKKGDVVTISYQSEHEGYFDYVEAIHEAFPGIHVSAKTSSKYFMEVVGANYKYDSMSYHPLGSNQPKTDVTDFEEHYYRQQASAGVTMTQEKVRKAMMIDYAKDDSVELILSAYGHQQGNLPKGQANWHLNLAEGMLCASELMNFAKNDFKIACNFLLNDMPFDPDVTDAPTARRFNAMVLCKPDGENILISAKGLAFSLMSTLAGETLVDSQVWNNAIIPLHGYEQQTKGGMFPIYAAKPEDLRVDSIDKLETIAALDENGYLNLIVMNNHAHDAQVAKVLVNGYKHESSVKVQEYNGDSFTALRTYDTPNAVWVEEKTIETGEGDFYYVFPAHSVTRFVLQSK